MDDKDYALFRSKMYQIQSAIVDLNSQLNDLKAELGETLVIDDKTAYEDEINNLMKNNNEITEKISNDFY